MQKVLPIFYPIFIVGLLLRIFVFFANPSYVHDDAALAMNLIDNGILRFFGGLEFCQVAPPFFMILSKFFYFISDKDYSTIDMNLRVVPFISGVISIPLFYYFTCLVSEDNFSKYTANLIFAFNPLLVSLCCRFKQYSTEIVIGLILYIIFYKLLTGKPYKKYYSLIIIMAPWFSLSSLIIIFSILLAFVISKRNLLNKEILCSTIMSLGLFAIIFLPANFSVNYSGMNSFWSHYGFMSFMHPQRFLLRLGEFFMHNHKEIETVLGLCILYKIGYFISNNKNLVKTLFLLVPIAVTLLLSFIHLYPFIDRLIAFLFPLFAIILSEFNKKMYSKISILAIVFLSLICSFNTIFRVYNLPNYRNCVEQYKNIPETVHYAYQPFLPVYKWYTHLVP